MPREGKQKSPTIYGHRILVFLISNHPIDSDASLGNMASLLRCYRGHWWVANGSSIESLGSFLLSFSCVCMHIVFLALDILLHNRGSDQVGDAM